MGRNSGADELPLVDADQRVKSRDVWTRSRQMVSERGRIRWDFDDRQIAARESARESVRSRQADDAAAGNGNAAYGPLVVHSASPIAALRALMKV